MKWKYRRTTFSLSFTTILTLAVFTIDTFAEKVSPEVYEVAQTQANLPLIIYLTEQPAFEIARQEQAVVTPTLRYIATQLEQMTRPITSEDVVPPPILAEVQALNQQRESLLEAMRAEIYSRTKARVQKQRRRFQRFVTGQLNGKITSQIILVNAFGVELPALRSPSATLVRLAQHPDVRSIHLSHPLRLALNTSAPAIGANYWWRQGFRGPRWYDVAVLDTGITFRFSNGLMPHRGSRNDRKAWVATPPDISDLYGHGTAVAGVIASRGSNVSGIAPAIDTLINAKVANDASLATLADRIMEAIEWSIHQSDAKAEGINISLTIGDIHKGTYRYSKSTLAQFIDFIVDTEWVPIVKAAGNRGVSGLTFPADAYNGIAVGNVQTRASRAISNDRLRPTSSRGPLPDGRKKPELVAPGSFIKTSSRLGGFRSALPPDPPRHPLGQDLVGTSFSAPHVAGAIALVSSVLSHEPYTIKALLLNTATDGFNPENLPENMNDSLFVDKVGWDRNYGYGYLNLYRAYYFRYVYPRSISPGERLYFTGRISKGHGDLGKMTIVWHKHVNIPDDDPPLPLSNLDLRLYDYTNGRQGDLLAASTSLVDNVEQVIYTGPPAGRNVLVEIRAVSTFDGGPEGFTLASMHPLETLEFPSQPAAASRPKFESHANTLGQNFPNPFNPETWIPYAIAKTAAVTIQVFDAQAQSVRTLNLGIKPAGRYFTTNKAAYWDGRNDAGERVASGTYFYYLQAGDFKATRKMVIEK